MLQPLENINERRVNHLVNRWNHPLDIRYYDCRIGFNERIWIKPRSGCFLYGIDVFDIAWN